MSDIADVDRNSSTGFKWIIEAGSLIIIYYIMWINYIIIIVYPNYHRNVFRDDCRSIIE